MTRKILLFLAFFCFLGSTCWAGGQSAEARVLSWGRNPDTGEVILVLSFRPDEWRKFEKAFGRPRKNQRIVFPVYKKIRF